MDARAYLDERRAAFRDVVAGEEDQKNAFMTLPGDAESAKSGKTMNHSVFRRNYSLDPNTERFLPSAKGCTLE